MFKLVIFVTLLSVALSAPAPKPSGLIAAPLLAHPAVSVYHAPALVHAPLVHAPLVHAPLVASAISSQYSTVIHGAKTIDGTHIAHIPLAHSGLVLAPYALKAW